MFGGVRGMFFGAARIGIGACFHYVSSEFEGGCLQDLGAPFELLGWVGGNFGPLEYESTAAGCAPFH